MWRVFVHVFVQVAEDRVFAVPSCQQNVIDSSAWKHHLCHVRRCFIDDWQLHSLSMFLGELDSWTSLSRCSSMHTLRVMVVRHIFSIDHEYLFCRTQASFVFANILVLQRVRKGKMEI